MGTQPTIVVDTNVLLNLGTPVVDQREKAPSGADPLKAVLSSYDVHVSTGVLGELGEAAGDDDLLAAAADLVLQASHHLTGHDVEAELDEPIEYGLDTGESQSIWLANALDAAMFVTDEFNSTNYLLVALALDDRNTLFTTPHLLCALADHETLRPEYVTAALTYYVDTKGWDQHYIERLRHTYLTE